MATNETTEEVAIQRVADIAMTTPRNVKKAMRGELVRGREGERIAVALRALGVPCVISPDLALQLKTRRIQHSESPMGDTRCHLSIARPMRQF